MRYALAAFLAVVLVGAVVAQGGSGAPSNPFAFRGGVQLGSDVLPTGASGSPETWTRLGFQPDISFGKFGIGVDLTIRMQLFPQDTENAVKIYKGDWIPSGDKTIFDIYLPKFLYIRYGLKGIDPIFAKLGSINDLTLGNGFIINNYSNMHFMPELRITGLDVGFDSNAFNIPDFGLEAVTGNLAKLDVVGGRVFIRPFARFGIPILKGMQLGGTAVMDMKPDSYQATTKTAELIMVLGGDLMVPVLGGKLFPMAVFADFAIEPNQTKGGMFGFGGKLLGLFTYGAQIRYLERGFIPSYFDANYDLYRHRKFDFMKTASNTGGDASLGWFASLGTSLIADKLVFNATLDGPFKATAGSDSQADYPHLRGVLRLDEIPDFPIFLDASYEKYFLGKSKPFFEDLVDPNEAVVGMSVNYKTGTSVLTMRYDASWDPALGKFKVRSSLQAAMKF
jgi:hypothetical protein